MEFCLSEVWDKNWIPNLKSMVLIHFHCFLANWSAPKMHLKNRTHFYNTEFYKKEWQKWVDGVCEPSKSNAGFSMHLVLHSFEFTIVCCKSTVINNKIVGTVLVWKWVQKSLCFVFSSNVDLDIRFLLPLPSSLFCLCGFQRFQKIFNHIWHS